MKENAKTSAGKDAKDAKAADKSNAKEPPAPPEPLDMVDGIPDRAATRPVWKLILIVAIFLVWMAFLVYCLTAK